MQKKLSVLGLSSVIASFLLGQGVLAQSTDGMQHSDGMNHSAMEASAGPTEPGQGAFAALSEIVALLVADPHTDWSQVNISALRDHLVDMDMLVTNAKVETRDIPGGLEMTLATDGLGGGAVLRMVPAHAPFLAAETGWDTGLENNGDTLIWTITSDAHSDQIRALGFFGLMSTGFHHTEHHLGMATGKMVH
ncbi:MAG: hypothetical protein V3V25_10480 [Paracoccaceae bacterium]